MSSGPRGIVRELPVGSAATVTDTEEGRAFFQERLATFGLCLLCMSGGFWVFGMSLMILGDPAHAVSRDGGLSEASLYQLIATAIAGGVWLALRRGRYAGRTLHVIDVASSVGMSFFFVLSGIDPNLLASTFVMVLAVHFTLITRAIVVPSTARRTLAICSVSSVLAVGVLTFMAARDSSSLPEPITPFDLSISSAMWCVLGVAIATVASRTIFGLRREVSQIRVLGQYALEEKIGEGGMGEVWRASHAMLRRPTAVKLLPPDRAGQAAIKRFEREVQLTARLTHPNTVAIFDYGRTPDGVFYYAMELLDGTDLEQLVAAHGPMPPGRVIHVLRQVCGALSEAHDMGLVHRDIKPANVILTMRAGEHDIAKVVDFGLVKDLDTGSERDLALTAADTITGTPLYLSPEAIRAPESVEARSDLYALGAVGVYLLTGKPPFEGRSVVEVCGHHMHSPPKRPSELGHPVPADLEDVLLACLAKTPAERPRDARALAKLLAACASAAEWTEEQAAAWWASHPTEHRFKPVSASGPRTIAVRLDERVKAA